MDSVIGLPVLVPYVNEFIDVLTLQSKNAKIDYPATALLIIEAAKKVPEVHLP